jgi:two-component system OmpR family response regulator
MLELTASEFALLAFMAQHPGRVFTRLQLLDAIRGSTFESLERAVDSHVKNLRKKLERDPQEPEYIQTVYGVGYRFCDINSSGRRRTV